MYFSKFITLLNKEVGILIKLHRFKTISWTNKLRCSSIIKPCHTFCIHIFGYHKNFLRTSCDHSDGRAWSPVVDGEEIASLGWYGPS
jgi:hypothetical protein